MVAGATGRQVGRRGIRETEKFPRAEACARGQAGRRAAQAGTPSRGTLIATQRGTEARLKKTHKLQQKDTNKYSK